MKQRIQTLDGLRFLAAIGVLWIHVWTLHGNPRFYISRFDLTNILAIGGNGVDLFFVISGFCMYYFYASKSEFSYQDFYKFIVKRWIRLSPAFYVATIIYILIDKFLYNYPINILPNLLHSIFYLTELFPKYSTASHFWTLTVEWQFYFIVPFLLIYQNKIGFKKIFFIVWGALFIVALASAFILKNKSNLETYTLLFRAVEFGFGVVAARLLIKNNQFFKQRALWLIVFILITYTGRILISKHVLNLSLNFLSLFKLLGFSLLGLGFGGILYLSVTSVKWLNIILGNRLFKSMGKVSYSFYLLHALIGPPIGKFVIEDFPFFKGIAAPIVTTLISATILYPMSLLYYNLLEKPFLAMGKFISK